MSFSYLPDLPPETPDIWTVCDGFHPDIYGNYRTGWLADDVTALTTTGASAAFQNGFAYRTADGTPGLVLTYLSAIVAGTYKAYVWNGAWNDRNAGAAGGATCFLQVGNTTLAGGATVSASVRYITGLVQRDASGTSNFAAVASSPNAGVLAVNALNIVMALDVLSDAFAFSDTNAPTIWTGGESTSGNCRLTPGNFTAGLASGNDFICFKQRGVYRAQYVSGSQKWIFTLLDPAKGAWGPGCAVNTDAGIVFCGKAGAYKFDGQGFERIDYGIWQTILEQFGSIVSLGQSYKETKMIWDRNARNVNIFMLGSFPSAGASRNSPANAFFSYNVVSGKWGYQTRLTEAGTEAFPAVFDIEPLNDYLTTATVGTVGGGGPVYSTDVGFFSSTDDRVKVLTTSFNATDLPGTNYKPKLRTYRMGRRQVQLYNNRVTPQWTKSDGAGTDLSTATVKNMLTYTSSMPCQAETLYSTVGLSSDQYRGDNGGKSAPFQSYEFQINCEAVIAGIEPGKEMKEAGVV